MKELHNMVLSLVREIEQTSPTEFFEEHEILDVTFSIDSQKQFVGATAYITLGGPTIWVKVAYGSVRVYGTWGIEEISFGVTDDDKEVEYTEYFEEFWEVL